MTLQQAIAQVVQFQSLTPQERQTIQQALAEADRRLTDIETRLTAGGL